MKESTRRRTGRQVPAQAKDITRVLLFLIALSVLAACGSKEKRPEYYDAVEAPDLQIPEGMSSPVTGSALLIAVPPMPPPAYAMETRPPRISSTTSGLDSNSSFNWSSRGLYLLVDDTPESAHRRLGLVIERSGMQRVRVDDAGVYRFDYYQTITGEDGFFSSLAFWRRNKAEDYSGAYQTFVEPDGNKSRVYIKYADGTDCEPDAAEHVLDVIRARMG